MNEFIAVSTKYTTIDGKQVQYFDDKEVGQHVRSGIALLIPIEENVTYDKTVTSAAVNTMQRMTSSLRPNKGKIPFNELHTGKTDDGIHEELMAAVKDLSNLMQRIVQSSSWRYGEFHEFDKFTFGQELNKISRWFDI